MLVGGTLLVAGAIANLGVALALVATGEPIAMRRYQVKGPDATGVYVQVQPETATINGVPAARELLPPWLHPGEPQGWHARITGGRWTGYDVTVAEDMRSATGWPFPALRYVPPPFGSVPPPARGAAPPRWIAMTGGRIPRHIYWPGFLANTLLYAAALALPLAFFPARSALRARRGRCPRCGYDITGCDQCPECGAAASGPAPLEEGHAS